MEDLFFAVLTGLLVFALGAAAGWFAREIRTETAELAQRVRVAERLILDNRRAARQAQYAGRHLQGVPRFTPAAGLPAFADRDRPVEPGELVP